jgi:hypothetical protein
MPWPLAPSLPCAEFVKDERQRLGEVTKKVNVSLD